MSRLLRLGAAAALAAGALLSTSASAYTCMPHVWEHTYSAAGQEIEAYRVGMVC
ncbi:MAG TPA: hypothetical protein VF519_05685 [Mycobacteriales bacterium]